MPSPLPDWLGAIRCIHAPGRSVFELRAIGTWHAAGEIVAWTEDHCEPAENWCASILAAHRQHPEWLAIGGGVVNAEDATTADWANFFTTFGPFVPPVDPGKTDRVPPAANISFKRAALPPGPIEAGELEFRTKRWLLDRGQLGTDDQILVRHIQPRALARSAIVHFHNGRCTSGLLARRLSLRKRLAWLLRCLALPAGIIRNVRAPLCAHGELSDMLRKSMPGIVLLAICHAAGEFAGLVLNGAGSSPYFLE